MLRCDSCGVQRGVIWVNPQCGHVVECANLGPQEQGELEFEFDFFHLVVTDIIYHSGYFQ